ncbi:hypothetical protein M9980_00315 [Sphingomonas donggukensis]|uniref:Inner membrane protein n=1 Tax=Sphingomonas donggukensis TaxID=2949093 RepID=A0ABY4TZG9_9SPHN|nr:hypothetical protein [Sphingomonas donggukensis]URW75718.1 hypothetical protein M9980_00315 [Sphingomonas donggukensis]
MTGDTPPPASDFPASAPAAQAPTRISWVAIVVAFLLGIATVAALLPVVQKWRDRQATPAAQPTPAPAAVVAQPTITAAAPQTLDALAIRAAALDAQLRGVEGRMAATDAASRTAAGYATRAEGLMIAFAARRALDRGLALGYVEGQLRSRFDADEPQAVATVIAAAHAPVTREDLRLALDTIAPTLSGSSLRDGFFRSVGRELSNLVVLRRESTPSPRPADRLERARRLIDAGNVEAALAEVARMPGATSATSWIEAAKRYNAARRALNTIELAAISGRTTPVAPTAGPIMAAPPTVGPIMDAGPAPAQNPAGQLPGN